jgi:hypothetical protein
MLMFSNYDRMLILSIMIVKVNKLNRNYCTEKCQTILRILFIQIQLQILLFWSIFNRLLFCYPAESSASWQRWLIL